MLDQFRNKAELRKFQLFACACCRQITALCESRAKEFMEDSQIVYALEFIETAIDDHRVLSHLARVRGNARKAARERRGRIVNEVFAAGQTVDFAIDTLEFATNSAVHNLACNTARYAVYTQSIVPAGDPDLRRASQAKMKQVHLVRDIFGNPFRPVTLDHAWLTGDVFAIAEAIYADRAFDRMPILGDALEDAGCANADILDHCRLPGEHVRGCWVVDLLLAKK
jgi:hypothetical protein